MNKTKLNRVLIGACIGVAIIFSSCTRTNNSPLNDRNDDLNSSLLQTKDTYFPELTQEDAFRTQERYQDYFTHYATDTALHLMFFRVVGNKNTFVIRDDSTHENYVFSLPMLIEHNSRPSDTVIKSESSSQPSIYVDWIGSPYNGLYLLLKKRYSYQDPSSSTLERILNYLCKGYKRVYTQAELIDFYDDNLKRDSLSIISPLSIRQHTINFFLSRLNEKGVYIYANDNWLYYFKITFEKQKLAGNFKVHNHFYVDSRAFEW